MVADAAVQRAHEQHRRRDAGRTEHHRVVPRAGDEARRSGQHRGEGIRHRHGVRAPVEVEADLADQRIEQPRIGRTRVDRHRRLRRNDIRRVRLDLDRSDGRHRPLARAPTHVEDEPCRLDEGIGPRVHRRRPGMVGAPLEHLEAARLAGNRRHDPERLVELCEHGSLLDVHLEERVGELGQPLAPHRARLLRAERNDGERRVWQPLCRLDRRDDTERSVEATRRRDAVEVRPGPHARLPAAAEQVPGPVARDLQPRLPQPALGALVRRVFLGGIARAMLPDRVDLLEPRLDPVHARNARSTWRPASGSSAIEAKPHPQDVAATSTPKSGGYAAPTAFSTVCCSPIAAPLRARPAISVAAAKARPFQLIAKTPVTTIDGTSSQSGAPTSSAVTSVSVALASAIVRSGAIRSPATSDQRPAAIRAPIPHSWIAASTPAAVPGLRPRVSCRKRTAKPTTHIWGATTSALPAASDQTRTSRSGAGPMCSASSSGAPSRSPPAPTPAAARHAAPGAPNAHGMPHARSIGGMQRETAKPPIGIAVCRIPSASPRWSAGNHDMTARPLDEWTLAPARPVAKRQAESPPKLRAWVASRSAPPHEPMPVTRTARSPKRSAAIPQGTSVSTDPSSDAEMRTPVSASERSYSSRSAGASTATPNQIAEYVAWAKVPAASTAQR